MNRKKSRPFAETSKELLKDPEAAALYLEEILADNNIELFKAALKDVADARVGGMKALAESTHLTREALHRALSKTGNPRLETLTKVLHATGLRLSITTEATT